MQGWRNHMEDAETALLSLEGAPGWAMFAVFDGHGGSRVSKYCGEALHLRVVSDPEWKAGNYEQAFKNGFLGTDQDILDSDDPLLANDPSGATSVVVAINVDDHKLYCANAGDSRAVLSRGGTAVPLSEDHKPDNKEESARITAAGGFVSLGRVNGSLALSRAIGDHAFKQNSSLPAEQQAVTALPDVLALDVTPEDEFFVVACDGIWDCMTSQQVIDFVRERIPQRATEEELVNICSELMMKCLAPSPSISGTGCDNMTVVIVQILRD